jgi:nickel-dependent lactate racemase
MDRDEGAIEISLGRGASAEIPKRDLPNLQIIEPRGLPPMDPGALFEGALRRPLDGVPLGEADGAAVIFPDHTRHPSPFMRELILELEKRCDDIKLICANGSHHPPDGGHYRRALGDYVYERYKGSIFLSSTNEKGSRYAPIGRTSRGTEVEVHEELLDRDLIISTGNVQPHFFAGYGGGAKAILPGCSSLGSIISNHALAIGDARARELILDGNPVREDMEEAAGLLARGGREYRVLDFVLNPDGSPAAAAYGPPLEAHRYLAEGFARAIYAVEARPAKLVISVADWPAGRNLMQALKAAWYASNIADRGGGAKPTVLLVAALTDGIGNPSLREEMTRYAGWEPKRVFEDLRRRAREGTLTETSQGPNRLAMDRERLNLIVASPSAPKEVVDTLEAAGYEFFRSVEEALGAVPPESKRAAALLPHGSLTVPLPKGAI